MFMVSEAWRNVYPGAAVGILMMRDVDNPDNCPVLDRHKIELENQLRTRFAHCDRADLKALAPIQAYSAYFKRNKKSYHVLLQLESVALKRRPIPRVAALVEAMFMAELKNLLLTAGHDAEAVRTPVRLDIADGDEVYVRLNGREQTLKRGDMMMTDAQGVISSVLYGPDRRTRITAGTRQALFAVYAPPGIGGQAVYQHLEDIETNVLLVAPEAEVAMLNVYEAR